MIVIMCECSIQSTIMEFFRYPVARVYILENRLFFLPTTMEFCNIVDPDPNTFETGMVDSEMWDRIYFYIYYNMHALLGCWMKIIVKKTSSRGIAQPAARMTCEHSGL